MRPKTLKRTLPTQLQLVLSLFCVGGLLLSGACVVEKDVVDGNQTESIDPGWTGPGGMGGVGLGRWKATRAFMGTMLRRRGIFERHHCGDVASVLRFVHASRFLDLCQAALIQPEHEW